MVEYLAPIADMRFVITRLGPLAEISALPGFADATPDLVDAVLDEAGRFAREVLSPLNQIGDVQGARYADGAVQTPDGWRAAYRQFVDGGWNGLACDPQYGGQGLPKLVATAVNEMWNAANLAFALWPMLTHAAVEAIEHHGSDAQRATYLPRLIAGTWTGTMNLTEPQAGSDLSAVRTRAVPEGDHYRITGQKIFITYGEQDLSENIVHLVLARTPDAPAGTRGMSLFIVPKFLVNADGAIGERNDVRCVSIEHKLGIHGSPTAVLAYGEDGGAIGYLVGQERHGLEYMFTMMNSARHAVGLEGVAIGERAYQHALGFARERIQGKPVGYQGLGPAAIIEHPDVRRMLLTMKSQVEAMRALGYACAAAFDVGARHPDAARRAYYRHRGDLLTPIVKGWCTETGVQLASLGVQVHGGMGFVEETGAAQYLRDVRITTIYEGTTGIQAQDLIGRKTLRDGGAAARELLAEIAADGAALAGSGDADLAEIKAELERGVAALHAVLAWVLSAQTADPRLPAAAAVHYLELWGIVAGGWQLARSARICAEDLHAGRSDPAFCRAKLATAHFFAVQVLPKAGALQRAITEGSKAVLAADTALL